MKLWGGRFNKELDKIANDFNSSIAVDGRMYREDITGSIAHATMLCEAGIITEKDFQKIKEGLEAILEDIESGKLEIDLEAEDIHMFVEQELTNRIGNPGKKLHTARSRNDQVAVDLRLHLRNEIGKIMEALIELNKTLIQLAAENIDSVIPGYTHLQVAQPVTFAHHIMAYVQMFTRDITRLLDCRSRLNENPLGSGALATTTYPINRERTAELLGFDRPTKNSLDSVSDRDFVLELHFCISTAMMHFSRLSEEVILWSSQEFKFIDLDDAYSTGSSIMPQKKNPDMAELARGKTGRVYGNLLGALTMMKGLPLAYNKDLQEDKEGIFDSVDTILIVAQVFEGMFSTLAVNKDKMREKAGKGFINATDCADYLVKKGLAFRDAYTITGKIVRYCVDHDETLESLELERYKEFSPEFEEDIYQYIDIDFILNQRNVYGGPGREAEEKQIAETRLFLEQLEAQI